jgi:hypothetical protein
MRAGRGDTAQSFYTGWFDVGRIRCAGRFPQLHHQSLKCRCVRRDFVRAEVYRQ